MLLPIIPLSSARALSRMRHIRDGPDHRARFLCSPIPHSLYSRGSPGRMRIAPTSVPQAHVRRDAPFGEFRRRNADSEFLFASYRKMIGMGSTRSKD